MSTGTECIVNSHAAPRTTAAIAAASPTPGCLCHGCVAKVTCDDETVVGVLGSNIMHSKASAPVTLVPPVGTVGGTPV